MLLPPFFSWYWHCYTSHDVTIVHLSIVVTFFSASYKQVSCNASTAEILTFDIVLTVSQLSIVEYNAIGHCGFEPDFNWKRSSNVSLHLGSFDVRSESKDTSKNVYPIKNISKTNVHPMKNISKTNTYGIFSLNLCNSYVYLNFDSHVVFDYLPLNDGT